MNVNKLRGIIAEKRLTQTQISKGMDISLQTLNAKLNNRSPWTLEDCRKLIRILDLENPAEIFFGDNISNMQQKSKNIKGE